MQISIINNPGKDEPFLIINKPANLPSAPLNSLEEDTALSQAVKLYPEILNIKGKKEIEYGLLHRIDTVTEGLLLIALNQDFYDSLILEQENNKFIKTYYAICDIEDSVTEGFPVIPNNCNFRKNKNFILESYFRAFGKGKKEVRPVIGNSGTYAEKKANLSKKYTTEVFIKNIEKNSVEVECKISQGFRHQVRNHLAWIGLPIKNDPLYNKREGCGNIQFFAIGLDFEYKGKKFSFRLDKEGK